MSVPLQVPLDEAMDADTPVSRRVADPRTPARTSSAGARARNMLASSSPATSGTINNRSIPTPPVTPAPSSRSAPRRSPQTVPRANPGRGRPRLSASTPSSRRAPRRSEPTRSGGYYPTFEDYNNQGDYSSDSSDDESMRPENRVEEISQDHVDEVETPPGLEIGMSTEQIEEYALQMCDMQRPPNTETTPTSATFADLGGHPLMPHQRKGVDWMIFRENVEEKKMGGILADDTGLGKTIQACALIKHDRTKNPVDTQHHPTLVVLPPSLVFQWQEECAKFVPDLKVVIHGSGNKKKIKDLLMADIVLTTYGVVRNEYTEYRFSTDTYQSHWFINDGGFLMKTAKKTVGKAGKRRTTDETLRDGLFRVKWRRVFLDEAHLIKNHKTNQAQACCALQTTFKWCLSATPLQNTVMDLYSLFRFLNVKPYNDVNWFKENIDGPIRRKNGTGLIGFEHGKAMKKLQLCLSRILIRRDKHGQTDGVKHLDVNPYIVHCNPAENRLSEDETRIYEALQARFSSILHQSTQDPRGEGGSRDGKLGLSTHCIFVLILRLRQACLHPQLLLDKYKMDAQDILKRVNEENENDGNGGAAEQGAEQEFAGEDERQNCKLCGVKFTELRENIQTHKEACRSTLELLARYGESLGERPMSERVRQVMGIIRSVPAGEKVIVFSQFRRMLDVLQPFLRDEGLSYVRYDGTLKEDEREKALEAVRKPRGAKIILMSMKAGGVGLNLPQCNHVILTDIWWNPAIEEQAIGRAHRKGQAKQVHVYRLVAEGTIESRMLALQEEKRELVRVALSKDQLAEIKSLTRDEVISLITGRLPGSSDTNMLTIVRSSWRV
ncbi:hypothetical protein PM082_021103 [Marasmius tenuissimus]|nr:hypothetical protein PM082_021103 [Marasmius tenuissimus]